MAEWGAGGENPPAQNKMLPIRKPPKTAHELPRENCLRSCVGFADPGRTLRAFHARNYECVPESFSPFGKRPSGFRKISPQTNFPGDRFRGRSNQQPPLGMAMGNGLPKPSRKKLK